MLLKFGPFLSTQYMPSFMCHSSFIDFLAILVNTHMAHSGIARSCFVLFLDILCLWWHINAYLSNDYPPPPHMGLCN